MSSEIGRINFSHAARCVTRSGRSHYARSPPLARSKNARPSLRRVSARGPRHVPQVVLILDVLFLFRLKAIALQHRVNHRRCHHHPFDRHRDIDCERASERRRAGVVGRSYRDSDSTSAVERVGLAIVEARVRNCGRATKSNLMRLKRNKYDLFTRYLIFLIINS